MYIGNIWNYDAIDAWLVDLSGGDTEFYPILKRVLRPALLRHEAALSPLQRVPETLPEGHWLRQKFDNAATGRYVTFNAHTDLTLGRKVEDIVCWLRAAQWRNDPLIYETDKASRLHFYKTLGTIDILYMHALDDMEQWRERDASLTEGMVHRRAGDTQDVQSFDNGWKIVRLMTIGAVRDEGFNMGHCLKKKEGDDQVLERGETAYYSLRDPAGKPHVTFQVWGSKYRNLIASRGRQNQPPILRYFPYVESFVRDHNLTISGPPDHTGIVRHKGAYHSIYNLPEGFSIDGSLDLSFLKTRIVLPREMKIRGDLIMNGYHRPIMHDDLDIGRNIITRYFAGRLHRMDGPAVITQDARTGALIRQEWHMDGVFQYAHNYGAADSSEMRHFPLPGDEKPFICP